MALVLVTPPANEPVTVEEAMEHLRVDGLEEVLLVEGLVRAAREYAETFTGRALITQVWDWTLDCWPRGNTIELPRPPLQSVDSVKYLDEDGAEHTVNASSYLVDTTNRPGRIRLRTNQSWPTDTLREISAITIRFSAGYGDDAEDVPQTIHQAMLLMIGDLYENREASIVGTSVVKTTFATDSLLYPYRIRFGF
jgi:uncharacterized phiE125 gp8 family phage protein